jgi:antitoxin ParD1/3/4
MRETMSLSLTPEQSLFVNSCVETGRYQSASEVIRAGLRLLADQEASRLAELDAFEVWLNRAQTQLIAVS